MENVRHHAIKTKIQTWNTQIPPKKICPSHHLQVINTPSPLDSHVAVDTINQDGVPPALGSDGNVNSDGADVGEIGIIRMRNSK